VKGGPNFQTDLKVHSKWQRMTGETGGGKEQKKPTSRNSPSGNNGINHGRLHQSFLRRLSQTQVPTPFFLHGGYYFSSITPTGPSYRPFFVSFSTQRNLLRALRLQIRRPPLPTIQLTLLRADYCIEQCPLRVR
jgi:hypothetical protein